MIPLGVSEKRLRYMRTAKPVNDATRLDENRDVVKTHDLYSGGNKPGRIEKDLQSDGRREGEGEGGGARHGGEGARKEKWRARGRGTYARERSSEKEERRRHAWRE